MERITHFVSLSVGVHGSDDQAQVFQDFSELSRSLADTHKHVTVTSAMADDVGEDDEDTAECDREHLIDREETLFKVRNAIYDDLRSHKVIDPLDTEMLTTDLINAMLNAGILFRERS